MGISSEYKKMKSTNSTSTTQQYKKLKQEQVISEQEAAPQKVASSISPEKVKALMQPKKGLESLPKISDTVLNAPSMTTFDRFKTGVNDVKNAVLGANKYLGDAANAANAAALKTASFGLSEKIVDKVAPKVSENIKKVQSEHPIATKVGEYAGYAVPYGGIETGVAKVGGKALAKASSNLGKRAIIGTTAGAVVGAAESAVKGDSVKDIAKNTAIGAGMGLGGELAVAGLGKVGKAILDKIKTKKPLTEAEKTIVKNNPDFFVDPYGNAMKDINKKPLLLEAPKVVKKEPITQVKYTTKRVPKAETKPKTDNALLDVVRKDLNINPTPGEVSRQSGADMINTVRKQVGINGSKQVGEGVASTKTILPIVKKQTVFNANPNKEMPFRKVRGQTTKPNETNLNNGNINSFTQDLKAQNGVKLHNGNIDTAKAKINYKPKEQSKFDGLFTRLRTQLVDRLAPLEKLEKNIRGNVASAEKSLYKQARLFEGVPEKANLIIDTELKPIIKDIESKGYSYKDLGLYAEMVHAKDVNAAGMKSGFTDSEINDVISKLGTKEMETARQQLMAYNDKRLQSLVDGQIISPEQRKAIKEKWNNYMPLNRFMDDDKVDFVSNLGKSFVNVGSPLNKLAGSERNIIDPIESMIKNTYKIENAIGKNKVGLQLSNLAKEDTGNKFIRKVADDEVTDRMNVVNITENGVKVKYEVEPEIYKTLKNLDKESSNILIKILQKPASVLRAGATLTPEFATRNPIRDVFNAFIVSKSGFNPITDFAAGLGSYVRKGELYKKFLENNAGYGNIISLDRQTHRNVIESAIKQPVYKKFVTVINPSSWIKVMRSISDATESATKIGEFRAALRSGATEQEAAYRARDLMDFARAGTSVKELNKVIAFLNANIQGKSKFIRAIKENPGKVIPKLFVSMALPSIGAYAAIHYLANDEQKAQIKDAPNWLRDSFWLVPVPFTDTVARVPKPFDAAAVSNSIERFLQYTMDNDKEAFDTFIKDFVKQQSIPSMLTGVMPILEGMTNYSFFREAPIIPKREEYLQPQDQYDIFTSEISKGIAKGVQKIAPESNFASPRIIDNTIRSTTAGLGGYVLDATDKLLGKQKPSKNTSQLPGLKGFTVNENSTGKSMEFVYNEKDRLTKEKNSLKLKSLNPKRFKYEKQKQLDYINDITDEVGELSKEIRLIQNSKILTSDEKRDKINVLAQQRNDLTRKAQQEYKSKW